MATDINIFLGVALMFALAILMTVLTFQNIDTFFVWLNVFSAFMVWSGLIPLWILVGTLILLTLILFSKIKKNGSET